MFTGIVRGISPVVSTFSSQGEIKLQVKRPTSAFFSQLVEGDSISVNGICLTIEKLLPEVMQFHAGHESLKITGWKRPEQWKNQVVNLEPPLRMTDFIGGHFISGHVSGMAKVAEQKKQKHSLLLGLQVPSRWQNYLWEKSFIAVNGVSLTINSVEKNRFFVCLVPETLKSTNLGKNSIGDFLTFEVDYWSLALINSLKKNH